MESIRESQFIKDTLEGQVSDQGELITANITDEELVVMAQAEETRMYRNNPHLVEIGFASDTPLGMFRKIRDEERKKLLKQPGILSRLKRLLMGKKEATATVIEERVPVKITRNGGPRTEDIDKLSETQRKNFELNKRLYGLTEEALTLLDRVPTTTNYDHEDRMLMSSSVTVLDENRHQFVILDPEMNMILDMPDRSVEGFGLGFISLYNIDARNGFEHYYKRNNHSSYPFPYVNNILSVGIFSNNSDTVFNEQTGEYLKGVTRYVFADTDGQMHKELRTTGGNLELPLVDLDYDIIERAIEELKKKLEFLKNSRSYKIDSSAFRHILD